MKYIITILASLLILVSCSKTENKHNFNNTKNASLGKYVYVDKADVIHSKRNCNAVFKKNNTQSVVPTIPKYIYSPNGSDVSVCSKCVTERQIEQIDSIINSVAYKNRRWLYDELLERNYEVPNWRIYNTYINKENNRKKLYDGLIIELKSGRIKELDIGSFEEFNSNMTNYTSETKYNK